MVVVAPYLSHPSFWYDEAASISVASRGYLSILAVAENTDLVHTPYYFVLHSWSTLFGWTELGTRSLSLLALAIATAGFCHLTQRSLAPKAATIATLLFIICPGIIWVGGEARGYALCLAASTWSTVIAHECLSGARSSWWLLYALLVVMSALFFLYSVLIMLTHLAMWWQRRHTTERRVLLCLLGSMAATLAVIAPFAWRAWQQRGQVSWIHESLVELVGKAALVQTFVGPANIAMRPALLVALFTAAIVALLGTIVSIAALIGACVFDKESNEKHTLFPGSVWFLAPTLLFPLVAAFGAQYYQERYLIWAQPGVCLLIAEGLAVLAKRRAPIAVAVCVAISLGMLVASGFQRTQASKADNDYRALAELGSSADGVVYLREDARGIGIAYPDSLVLATDILLNATPEASDTLFGINGGLTPLHGYTRLIVYYYFTDTQLLEKFVAEALEPQCREIGREERRYFSGALFDCS